MTELTGEEVIELCNMLDDEGSRFFCGAVIYIIEKAIRENHENVPIAHISDVRENPATFTAKIQ